MEKAKYRIGGEVYSANMIEFGILRSGLCPPDNGMPTPKVTPFQNLLLESKDQRIDFAIFRGVMGMPVITVYKPETVDEDIEKCITATFEHSALVSNTTKTIYVPKHVLWYVKDFPSKIALQTFLMNFIKAVDGDANPSTSPFYDIHYNEFPDEVRVIVLRECAYSVHPPFVWQILQSKEKRKSKRKSHRTSAHVGQKTATPSREQDDDKEKEKDESSLTESEHECFSTDGSSDDEHVLNQMKDLREKLELYKHIPVDTSTSSSESTEEEEEADDNSSDVD